MQTYRVLGADGKECGPINEDVLRQWIEQKRADATTSVQAEGESDWKPLSAFPEFAAALTAGPPVCVSGGSVPAGPPPCGPVKTSGLAIASLVCGVWGFLLLPALAGLVLGIIALMKISRSQGQLRGQGLAIAGICLSGIMLLALLPLGLLLPALSRAKARTAAAALNTNTIPVDLTSYYNARLDQQWNPTSYPGDDLAELPTGLQEFDGVRFDIRGLIQLQGGEWQKRGLTYPEKVEGIPVGRLCQQIDLLHADGGASARPGTTVANLVLHYSDGTTATIPIQHDIHVKDWWDYGRSPPSDPNTVVAWTGQNKATARMGNRNRLYLTRFDNPHPEKKVESLDYVSAMAAPGPFMVALTVE